MFCCKIAPDAVIEEVIDILDDKFVGIMNEYMILIDEEDKKVGCLGCPSLYETIQKNKKILSGELHIFTMEQYSLPMVNKEFRIAGEPLKHQLYKRLPSRFSSKTGIFVLETDFAFRDYSAKYDELLYILGILNVKSVKVNIVKEETHGQECEFGSQMPEWCSILSASIPKVEVSIKDELHKKMELGGNGASIDKKYSALEMAKLLKVNSKKLCYYYRDGWKSIIERRLNGYTDGTHRSEITENQQFGAKLVSMGLDSGTHAGSENKIIYEYSFEYHPLFSLRDKQR